jgi:hypothetical protein
MKQIDNREGSRRQTRSIGLFLVIYCWVRDLDAVVLNREHLERLLGLQRFKGTRVKWLQDDLKEFFPYQQFLVYPPKDSFAGFFVSRVDLSEHFPSGRMSDSRRCEIMRESGIKVDEFDIWPRPAWHQGERLKGGFEAIMPVLGWPANFDERILCSYLALISQGQISPRVVVNSFVKA